MLGAPSRRISRPLLTEADHDPALREAGPALFARCEQLERALEARAGPYLRGTGAAPSPSVVVQDVGRGGDHDPSSAAQSPLKSGIRTSTAQPGTRLADLAGCRPRRPPRRRHVWSSRFTEVIDGVP